MTERCETCRFWKPWHKVTVNDALEWDEASKMLGHCEPSRPFEGSERVVQALPRQGLTAEDYSCPLHQPKEGEG